MVKLESLDPSTTFQEQLQQEAGPVVLVNMFSVPEGTLDQTVAKWKEDAEFMKHQPGYISAQLHRGTGDSHLLVNIAVWESTATLVSAFSSPEFQAKHDGWPEGTVAYPHLFQKVAVEGVCLA
jgi:heme-degrading monooxygenase HmoA